MKLENKVALITGGANGIGRVTAEKYLLEGAKVIISDINEESGKKALEELKKLGEAEFFAANVSDAADVNTLVEKTMDLFGRIDILVNNAGITIDGRLTKMEEADWKKVIDVNLTGVFNCTKAVVPHMVEQNEGVILNASSVVGIYGNFGQTNYAATKAGVIGLTKSWAKEFGPKGVRVNAVAPGFIQTDMTADMPEKVLNMMKEKAPLKKLGQPEDIAAAYLFLASKDASFINGTVLSVDGGLVM